MDLIVAKVAIATAYVVLGAAVLAAGARARANRAFALYAIGSGADGFVDMLGAALGVPAFLADVANAAFYLLIAAAVILLAIAFPEPLRRQDKGPATAVALGALVLTIIYAVWLVPGVLSGFYGLTTLPLAALGFSMAVTTASTALFALRAARTPRLLASYAVMAIAVFLPLGIASGSAIGTMPLLTFFGAMNIAVAAAAWMATAVRVSQRTWPIAVSWIVLGSAFAAQVASPLVGDPTAVWDGTVAAVRVVAIAPLAFMILRGQVPGFETKVRWTVSRGTIAAAFVAAFFVASEGAQILFGQDDKWVGLFAAGALVFAIAPLQRAAERFASRAVPVGAPVPVDDPAALPLDAHYREEVYRNAVRLALRDKQLVREEEHHLFRLAHSLHIDAARAHEVIAQIEREREGDAS